MTRRGNNHKMKVGVDRRTSKHTKNSLDSEVSSTQSKGGGQERDSNACPVVELPNGFFPESSSYGNDTKNSGSDMDDGKDWKNMKTSSYASEIDERLAFGNSSADCQTSILRRPRSRKGSLHTNGNGTSMLSGRFRCLINQLYLTILPMARYSSKFYFLMLKTVDTWLEWLKPNVVAMQCKLRIGYDFVKWKFQQAYPIFLNRLVQLCNILLLLLIIWFDCALRGINSFVRLGTVSFFSVLWFSLLSLIAMAGMTKFLIVLVIATLVGVFVGLLLGILILAISAIIFLWLYGSFWSTLLVIIVGGLAFMLSHERLTLLIATVYSMYCAWAYVGWLGLVVALNLSFFSSTILVSILTSTVHHSRESTSYDQSTSMDRQSGVPSTSGRESELTSQEEVERILSCNDHYEALGLPRYVNVDVSLLKREYKKKAFMVHPDKNLGNANAAEAFKKLQNAHEVLLDSLKRKAYDDELRNEELINYFKNFHSTSIKNRRNGFFSPGFSHSEDDRENPFGDSRRIACEKCGGFHLWISTKKPKSRARWCQECNDFHHVKDGDGWVEQFPQPFLFGLFQKVDSPSAYVCADSKIYEVTEWFICKEMRCPANSHKPSFHVNTSIISKPNKGGKRSNSGNRSSKAHAFPEDDPSMNREELFHWFQNAMRSGSFENSPSSKGNTPSPNNGASSSGGSSKRKKNGKKQW